MATGEADGGLALNTASTGLARDLPAPTPFAACFTAAAARSGGRRARHTSLLVSGILHVAALVIAAGAWRAERQKEEAQAPLVHVTMSSRPQLRVPALAALSNEPAAPAAAVTPPAPTPPVRPRSVVSPPAPIAPKPKPPAPRPEPAPVPTSQPAPEPREEPEAAAPVAVPEQQPAAAPVVAAEDDAVHEDTAPPTAPASGGLGTTQPRAAAGGLGGPTSAPALSNEQRQMYLERYLRDILRSRIAAHFRYPEEAEELGVEGLVILRISVLPNGALSLTRVEGRCPHTLLCAAAEQTVRDAAPFPPPPVELGGAISVSVPFQYQLE